MIATFHVANRKDILAVDERGQKYNDGSSKLLQSINLYSKADFLEKGTAATPIKTVHFEYTYELCPGVHKDFIANQDSGKLTLKKVWFTYNKNNKGRQNPYIFNYTNNRPYNAKYYDKWGNYKNPLDNPNSTASDLINNDEFSYSIQDSAKAALNASAWALDSILLPAGGAIKVYYESDEYAYVQNKRTMSMQHVLGFASSAGLTSNFSKYLYSSAADNQYVYFALPVPVLDQRDFYNRYLDGIEKLYFRLYVKMPTDEFGSGYEYVSGYAQIDASGGFGLSNNSIGWVKLKAISIDGDPNEKYSPLVKSATQFLRLNLPSKAYPGSETDDDLSIPDAVKMLGALGDNITNTFKKFDRIARDSSWAREVDIKRSFIRLNDPDLRKFGGGHRIKRVVVYDSWDKMTGQRPSIYGQDYLYSKRAVLDKDTITCSSGVASYEPALGGDENPFRLPIEYSDKAAMWGPTTLGYSEEPLGESLFPSPGVGYSSVRVRTIHAKNKKSANGYEETTFFTAYDFPTFVDRSLIDDDTKKRYKPSLSNFLRVNAKHHVVVSQGFKVELNDMHGKLRTKAFYAESDSLRPTSFTENFYKVENPQVDHKRLSNTVAVMRPDGTIDTSALIGKEVELMVDMRQQLSVTTGTNVSLNAETFLIPFIPGFFVFPSMLNLYQREENLFRSVATTKVIQRYGILDSVIQVDKGSKLSTKDMLYDSETGDVLLSRTQNEFEDYVYNFTYPSHWAYDNMGLAFKNSNVTVTHARIAEGKLLSGNNVADTILFSSGDEVLVGGKLQTKTSLIPCFGQFSTFPSFTKVWVIDSSVISGGPKSVYFIDRFGKPYNAFDVSLKVVRSGRRNLLSTVGGFTSLVSPLKQTEAGLVFSPDSSIHVINSAASEFKQYWNVEDRKISTKDTTYFRQPCPVGYVYSESLDLCVKDTSVIVDSSYNICLQAAPLTDYSSCGSFLYSKYDSSNSYFLRSRIDTSNHFWININNVCHHCNYEPEKEPDTVVAEPIAMAISAMEIGMDSTSMQMQSLASSSGCPSNQTVTGPMARAGVWACPQNDVPNGDFYGFTVPVSFPESRVYYFGMGADNGIRVKIDSVLFKVDHNNANENFKIWHIYPKFVTKGTHAVTIEGRNESSSKSFGLEIYNNDEYEIRNATSYSQLNLLLSTKDLIGRSMPSSNGCPVGYSLDSTSAGDFVCRRYLPVDIDTMISTSCRSIVSDTIFNPYVAGALGNWRAERSYSYYNDRVEQEPAVATNIRKDGSIKGYIPFWQFGGEVLRPIYDTTRWVWNSKINLYNRKGQEIENSDPLGRYNSGLYGYNMTLPIAVVQNGRYRESAFDGFEDYSFPSPDCDTSCASIRHFDFSTYKNKRDTLYKHSGRYSLRLNGQEQASLNFTLSDYDADNFNASMLFSTQLTACSPKRVLKSLRNTGGIVLPSFAPVKGRKMVLSAWVREDQDCKCTAYSNNQIVVQFTEGAEQTFIFTPTGNIIDGWQRYEGTFEVPAGASVMAVSLRATGSTAVNFDDIRIHPYNANMKSFVFHPVTLRLMAELDENNYTTFYEYDDEGTLIRLKKETIRGIKTIKETRSALVKGIHPAVPEIE